MKVAILYRLQDLFRPITYVQIKLNFNDLSDVCDMLGLLNLILQCYTCCTAVPYINYLY